MTHVPSIPWQRQNRPFIGDGEIMLCFYQGLPAKGDFIGETHHAFRSFETARDALAEIGSKCTRIIRFSVRTLQGEDVSEELAGAWLADWDGDPSCDYSPPFVYASEAFEDYCEAFYRRLLKSEREADDWKMVAGR